MEITVEYTPTGTAPYLVLGSSVNDGTYVWHTANYADGTHYKIRVTTKDRINNINADTSDNTFTVDNKGPQISNLIIKDTTIGRTDYTKNRDNLEITATITGDPVTISADLSKFGKGTTVAPNSYSSTIAKWLVNNVTCTPSNGAVIIKVTAVDSTNDVGNKTASIIADNSFPTVNITRPVPGVYFLDFDLNYPFSYPLILGEITFVAEAEDTGSGIKKVEFYLQDALKANATDAPYEWLWDEGAFGFFDLEVRVYDNVGHQASSQLKDFFILNLDILFHQ
jgi:hypothetical protein